MADLEEATNVRVHRYPDEIGLTRGMAGQLAKRLSQLSPAPEGKINLGLSGGESANQMYRALANLWTAADIDSSAVELWWTSERYVPSTDARRNSTQALAALAGSVDVIPAQTHAMPSPTSTSDPDQAAMSYAQELGNRRFDICLLTLAEDGHIADLYAGGSGLSDQTVSVIGVVDAPNEPKERITCTLQTINDSTEVWVLASGYSRADAVVEALRPGSKLPAGLVRGREVTRWFVDERAASKLPYHTCNL